MKQIPAFAGDPPRSAGIAGKLLWLAALAAPAALLVRRLCFFWETDPQYAYGWSVPFLAAVLFALRWPFQPPRIEPRKAGALLLLSSALILPARILQEAAPDWSAANWSFGLIAVLVTFLFLYRTGGRAWACWFLFPLFLLLTAIPWPQRFDLWLTQALMRKVAAATVELLGWLDIPAFRDGNLIRLPAGSIGIDEACSGIRSLQAMFMVSLFLGDLCRLPLVRRVGLVSAGILLALAGNIVRTTLLSTVASQAGIQAIHSWHDPAGLSILCFGLAGAWLLAARWRVPVASGAAPQVPIPVLPAFTPAALILSLLATEALVQVWYGSHESGAPAIRLAISWPTRDKAFTRIPISDSARRILLFSRGDAASWQDAAGRSWSLYHIVWDPGRTSTQSARMHRPETCLEATGAILVRESGVEEVPLHGGSLSCRAYLFQRDNAPLYVLFSLFEQRPADRDSRTMLQDWSGWSRIQRALAGQRNLGQETVELALAPLPGDPDPIAAMKLGFASLVSFPPAQTSK